MPDGGSGGAAVSRGASAEAWAAANSASVTKLTSVTRIASRSEGFSQGRPQTASAISAAWPAAETIAPVGMRTTV